jgi:hypothetical protein
MIPYTHSPVGNRRLHFKCGMTAEDKGLIELACLPVLQCFSISACQLHGFPCSKENRCVFSSSSLEAKNHDVFDIES